MLAVVLVPALLQEDCGMVRTWNLKALEVEAAGLNRVVAFDESVTSYDIWTTAGVDTIVVRAVSVVRSAPVSFELSFGGPVTSGDLGVRGGEVTLNIPPDTVGLLKIGVTVSGITSFYEVDINPPCSTGECDDANPCTNGVCNVSTCEFTALANGTSCPIALSDCSQGSGPGAGTCQSGLCQGSLELCPCDADTAHQALPKECVSGKVYDPITTTCTCDELGADVPAGGTCAEFGPPVVAGCELPGLVFNSQLTYNVFIFFGVTSPGAGGPGTVDHHARLRLESTSLSPMGGLEALQAADVIIGSEPTGNPATLVNSLDPALAGQFLGAFKDTATVVDLDTEILDATTVFEPASGESVDFQLVDFVFQLEIVVNGQILTLNKSMCTFDNPGTVLEPGAPPADGAPISCPVRVAP
jgi:hypothetical protein